MSQSAGRPAVQAQRDGAGDRLRDRDGERTGDRPPDLAQPLGPDYLSRRAAVAALFSLGLSSETAAHAAEFIRTIASRARRTSSRIHGLDPLKLASLSGIKSWCRIETDDQVVAYVRAVVALGAVKAEDLHPVARELCKLDSIHADPVFVGVRRDGDARLEAAIAGAVGDASGQGDEGIDDDGEPRAGNPGSMPHALTARERYRARTHRLPASDLKRLATPGGGA